MVMPLAYIDSIFSPMSGLMLFWFFFFSPLDSNSSFLS